MAPLVHMICAPGDDTRRHLSIINSTVVTTSAVRLLEKPERRRTITLLAGQWNHLVTRVTWSLWLSALMDQRGHCWLVLLWRISRQTISIKYSYNIALCGSICRFILLWFPRYFAISLIATAGNDCRGTVEKSRFETSWTCPGSILCFVPPLSWVNGKLSCWHMAWPLPLSAVKPYNNVWPGLLSSRRLSFKQTNIIWHDCKRCRGIGH